MNNTNTTTTAADLAANFEVTELEPRLENAWGGGDLVPSGEPSGGDGQGNPHGV